MGQSVTRAFNDPFCHDDADCCRDDRDAAVRDHHHEPQCGRAIGDEMLQQEKDGNPEEEDAGCIQEQCDLRLSKSQQEVHTSTID